MTSQVGKVLAQIALFLCMVPLLYLVSTLGFITRQTSQEVCFWDSVFYKWSFLITTVCVLNGALRVSRSKA